MEIVAYEGHQIWDAQLSTPGANCANFILPCLKRISGSYHKKQSRLNKCIIWQCFLCLHEIMKRNEFDSLTFHIARLHIIALYHDLHSIWQLYLFLISILTKSNTLYPLWKNQIPKYVRVHNSCVFFVLVIIQQIVVKWQQSIL